MEFCDKGLYLYSAHRDGRIMGFDIKNEKPLYDKIIGRHWFTLIKRYKSKNYAILGARESALMIIELKRGKIVKKISLSAKGLNSAAFCENELMMVFADGNMLVCDMQKNKNEVLVSLKIEDYAKAKRLIDNNILLYLDGTIEKLYDNGQKVLKQIVRFIELGKIDDAVKLAQPFTEDEEFSEKFNSYMSNTEEITRFITHIRTKDFAAAYRLSDKYQYIKEVL